MAEIYACDVVRDLRQLYHELLDLDSPLHAQTIARRLEWQASRAFESFASGNRLTTVHLSNWSPVYVTRPIEEIMSSPITIDDFRVSLAREYGYRDWEDVEKRGDVASDLNFEKSVDLVLSGDVAQLQAALARDCGLSTKRSDYGHRATLLHYLAANGVETHRQVVPLNAADVATVLIASGADPSANAEIYGGSDVMALLLSSSHPAEAGVTDTVATVLKSDPS